MSKLYSLLTVVFPILLVVGIIQVALMTLSPHKRIRINFILFGFLAFASIRPNLLGETFGIIGPFYFLVLLHLSKLLEPEYIVDARMLARARSALFGMYLIVFIYWVIIGLFSSLNNYNYNAWPPIANLGTIGLDSYFLLQIFKHGSSRRLLKVFIAMVTFQAFACLISKYFLNYGFCVPFNLGRGWDYSFCAPGVIYSLGTRLTGFGGEPSIFATYLCLTIVLVWWPQFRFRAHVSLIISTCCVWASIISQSTTGITLVLLAIALIPFQRITINKGPLVLVTYSTLIYYLLSTKVLERSFNQVKSDKVKSNSGSITDRSLDFGLGDYITRWSEHPIGHEWGVFGNPYAKSINLLAESLQFGPIVIILFVILITLATIYSRNPIQLLSASIVIFTTCLFLQPTWLNSIWFVLIYSGFLVNLVKDSELKLRKQI